MAKTPSTPAEDTSAANAANPSPDAFDVKRIRQLVMLMTDNGLTEIDLEWQGSKIRLKRGFEGGVAVQPMMMAAPVGHAAHAPAAAAGSAPAAAAAPAVKLLEVKSPLVGTFYTQPSPDSPTFVKIGDRVSEDTTVCIVEAMKVFNEIPARVRGIVKEICVETGTPVEFDQVLFRVAPE